MDTVGLVFGLLGFVFGATALARTTHRRSEPAPSDDLPEDVLGLRQEVAALRADSVGSLTHLAVVRYDAFGDMGGHLSWTLALVDGAGNGALVTSIHGRSDSRTYAKSVTAWSSDQQLSPEEEQALREARAGG